MTWFEHILSPADATCQSCWTSKYFQLNDCIPGPPQQLAAGSTCFTWDNVCIELSKGMHAEKLRPTSKIFIIASMLFHFFDIEVKIKFSIKIKHHGDLGNVLRSEKKPKITLIFKGKRDAAANYMLANFTVIPGKVVEQGCRWNQGFCFLGHP